MKSAREKILEVVCYGVLWDKILKIQKNSKRNFKVSNKKRIPIPLYTHFQKFITIKKNRGNKKTYILIPMIPLYFIISKRNKQ